MSRRAASRYVMAYALCAALGLPFGWALAQRSNVAAASAQGAVSLGAVVPAASSKPAKDDPHDFTMTGGVTGLLPGRSATLPVLVSNPNSQSIKVLTISVTTSDASKTCLATSNLVVTGYDSSKPGAASYVVPARGTATVPLPVQLVDAPGRNQNACKGVTFPLSYAGTAMQWGN
jgi:hypothetical protein